jgi:hypothetical protein
LEGCSFDFDEQAVPNLSQTKCRSGNIATSEMLLEKRVSGACGKRMQKYIGLSRHLAMSPLYSPCVRVSCSCSLPPALLIQAQRPLSQVWQAREWNCEVIQLSENADKNMFGRRKIGCGQQSQYVESAIWYA